MQSQVNVFPHDEWEDLDLERGVFKAPAAPHSTDSAVVGARGREGRAEAPNNWCCLIIAGFTQSDMAAMARLHSATKHVPCTASLVADSSRC